MGSQATREADGVLFTRAGLEIGVAATKTFVCQVAVMYLLGLRLAELRGTLEPRADRASWSASSSACRTASTRCSRACGEQVARDRRGVLAERVLPLHRPPRRPAGRARGRAEAQGDLLHRHRRLRGRRDEARADRAARRVHAGRLRRDRLAGAREARLEHAGGARARRARDRDRDRRQRADRASTPTRRSRCRRSTGCCSRCSR